MMMQVRKFFLHHRHVNYAGTPLPKLGDVVFPMTSTIEYRNRGLITSAWDSRQC